MENISSGVDGVYDVEVSGLLGSVRSRPVKLVVNRPVEVLSHPASVFVVEGGTAAC
jgi:hypothetical protein